MKRVLLLSTAAALWVACSSHKGDDISASRTDKKESVSFGSATDIARADGSRRNTNEINVADNGLGGPAQRQAGNYQHQPVRNQTSDEELSKQIRVALTTGSMGTTGVISENELTSIHVEVEEGVVTLTGPASTEAEKESITKQISHMKGVRRVVNNLTVGRRNLQDKPLIPRTPQG